MKVKIKGYSFSSWRSCLKVAEALDFADLLVEVDSVLAAWETLLLLFLAMF